MDLKENQLYIRVLAGAGLDGQLNHALDDQLNQAIDYLQECALLKRDRGILMIRHSVHEFTLELNPGVPYGETHERDLSGRDCPGVT